jgi:2'-deoxynucleoside 5'-phosphate N-hydrolase
MNVYFSCSLTGGRQDEAAYAAIVSYLIEQGHQVPTAHLASPDVMALERVVNPQEVFHRDIAWIGACHAVIAEVSTPSHGVGYEIAYALREGKPVLCCYDQRATVSKMILGNTTPGLVVQAYAGEEDLLAAIATFLHTVARA